MLESLNPWSAIHLMLISRIGYTSSYTSFNILENHEKILETSLNYPWILLTSALPMGFPPWLSCVQTDCHLTVWWFITLLWVYTNTLGTSYVFQKKEEIGNRKTDFSDYSMMNFQGSLRLLIYSKVLLGKKKSMIAMRAPTDKWTHRHTGPTL